MSSTTTTNNDKGNKKKSPDDDDTLDQSWDTVISTTRVVANRAEALASARVPSSSMASVKAFAWKSLKKFWRWHVPLVAMTFVVVEALRILFLLWNNMDLTDTVVWTTVMNMIMRDFSWALFGEWISFFQNDVGVMNLVTMCFLMFFGLLGRVLLFMIMLTVWLGFGQRLFSLNDYGVMTLVATCFLLAIGLFSRVILVTIILVVGRIGQRLSWRTTELGTFPSVKDDARYQDEQLLAKAWTMAFQHQHQQHQPTGGIDKDPTQCSDYQEGVGGGAIVMQPCPGYCGIATLNSTLRTFGGVGGDVAQAPYLSLHSHTRYVTLEEMCQLVQEKVIRSTAGATGVDGSSSSEWERGGGGRVDSMQVIGGGSHGLKCLEQFKAALRQLSHPTQPARIMAIYHRSPLFFCAPEKSLSFKLACFAAVHWSPILAYLEEDDVVLVMDVNHTYGPKGYLVPTQRLFDAVNTRDIFNGNYHGLILLRPPPPPLPTNKNAAIIMPLVTSPRDLSVAFGGIKQAYYRHQAAGRKALAEDILASKDDGYHPLQGNEQGEKLIRLVTINGTNTSPSKTEPSAGGVSAVIAAHPCFFANEIFLDPGQVPSLESVQTMVNVFTKLRVPPRVAVRGFDDATMARKVHRILTAAGLVQLVKPIKVAFLNLEPLPRNLKTSTDRLPQGYYIQEITFHPDNKGQQRYSPAVEALGRLIVESYKLPSIFRRGQTPSDFYAQAYQTFKHGGSVGSGGSSNKGLRHFGCYERESGTLASCVALFCGDDGTTTIRPDVAAIYNVCTSPNHRRKGLGMTMTLHALEVAKTMGCQQVVLEASAAGQPLYESMGFVVVEEPLGGIYVSLSSATDDFKWKNGFRLLELYYRLKNGGMWYYYDEIMRQSGIKSRR